MRTRISVVLVAFAVALSLFSCASSDVVISTKVKAKLAGDEAVQAYKIDVDTKDGQVTLTGNIDSHQAHERAIQLAKETKGVKNVVDMISVKTASTEGDAPDVDRTLGERIDDATITARVKTKLLDDPQVRGLKLDVDTREGVVFLTGKVRSEGEKEAAIQLTKGIKGVRDVQANITISSI